MGPHFVPLKFPFWFSGRGQGHHLLIKTGSESCFGQHPTPKPGRGAPGAPKCPLVNSTRVKSGNKSKKDGTR